MWKERLKQALSDAEFETGLVPSAILVRPEVFSELCFEEYGEYTILDLIELDGTYVSMNAGLAKDYLILVDVYAV